MNKHKTLHFIGCGILGPDIKKLAKQLNIELTYNFLPSGLHNSPEDLRPQLQDAINRSAKDPSC